MDLHHNININDFIHTILINSSKEFNNYPQLFWHKYKSIEEINNRNKCYEIIETAIFQTIKTILPMRDIIHNYINNPYKQKSNINHYIFNKGFDKPKKINKNDNNDYNKDIMEHLKEQRRLKHQNFDIINTDNSFNNLFLSDDKNDTDKKESNKKYNDKKYSDKKYSDKKISNESIFSNQKIETNSNKKTYKNINLEELIGTKDKSSKILQKIIDKQNDDIEINKKYSSHKIESDRKSSDKKYSDKKESDKKYSDRKESDKKLSDKKSSDKKYSDKKLSDKKYSDRKESDKKLSDKKYSDRKESDKKYSDKKLSDIKIDEGIMDNFLD
jgi:hypothetical protein